MHVSLFAVNYIMHVSFLQMSNNVYASYFMNRCMPHILQKMYTYLTVCFFYILQTIYMFLNLQTVCMFNILQIVYMFHTLQTVYMYESLQTVCIYHIF